MMLNKLLAVVVFIELICLMLIKPINTVNKNYQYSINTFKVNNIDKAKLENYIIGVVAAEMPATFSIEALKAQAVAARTFAYRKIIDNKLSYDDLQNDKGQAYYTINDMKSVWGNNYDKYYNKIANAVLSTSKEILVHNGNIINAYYFSISNGQTENSSNVFGEQDYLVSVESPWDKNYSQFNKHMTLKKEDFKSKLNLDGEISIDEIKKNSTNHVEYIVINNQKYDGVEIRKKLNLRSTDFEISVNNEQIDINTKGHGHGVGMSQYGADGLAKEGKSYTEILKYYYRDVYIEKI